MQITHISVAFSDARGEIVHILDIPADFKTVLFISSNSGAIRANHYHKKDSHYTYLISGKFEYGEKSLQEGSKLIKKNIKPGDLVLTKPKIIHYMKFLEDSTMIVFTTEPRDQKHYEADTVRVKLI